MGRCAICGREFKNPKDLHAARTRDGHWVVKCEKCGKHASRLMDGPEIQRSFDRIRRSKKKE